MFSSCSCLLPEDSDVLSGGDAGASGEREEPRPVARCFKFSSFVLWEHSLALETLNTHPKGLVQ